MKRTDDVSNYIKFLKQLEFNTRNGYSFKVTELMKSCDVDNKVTQAAARVGILDIIGRGPAVKYVFNVPKIEPIHARNTMKELHKMQRGKYQKVKERKETGKLKKAAEQISLKETKKTPTPATPVVSSVGSVKKARVKTMTVKTVRTGLFRKEVTTSYTYE